MITIPKNKTKHFKALRSTIIYKWYIGTTEGEIIDYRASHTAVCGKDLSPS